MGKGKPIVMFIFAIVIAFFFTVLTFNWLQRLKKQKAEVAPVMEAEINTRPIAVAISDLSWGTSLTGEMIKMVPFLVESLPAGTFSESSDLIGRTLIYPVKADEPIFESKLAPVTIQTGGIAAVVTPTKRAMSVKVDKVIGVSGFIYPGHRVDVLVTLKATRKDQEYITKTVLENILVLAAGTEIERIEKIDKKEKPSQVDVITLEVTPDEAEKLALAATQGRLLLALRNFSDNEDITTKGMTIPSLLSAHSPSSSTGKSQKRKRVWTRKPVFYVELIKGDKITKLRF
ncbi:MAG: Flp pilus assembly protein CpaB [bacterium]